jgi:hypothetical protein
MINLLETTDIDELAIFGGKPCFVEKLLAVNNSLMEK